MKKFMAMLLILCLLFSSVSVFAASKTSQQTFNNEKQKDEMIIPVTEKTGTWSESTAIKNYDGGKHIWSREKDATLTFKVSGIKAGNYEMYYWVAPHVYNEEQMKFEVFHNGKTSSASVYQKLEEGETVEPGWVSMGVFDFAGSGDEKITHVCPGGNTRGTGVKLVPTTKEVTAEKKEEQKPEQKPEDKKPTDTNGNVNLAHEIDAAAFDGFSWVGNWQFSSALTGPMKRTPGSMWIAAATENDYCQYDPAIQAVGDVRISVYLLAWKENQTPDVKYEVHHNGKVDEFHFDTTPEALPENKWETLGTFDFAGTGDEFVRVVGTSAGGEKTNTRAATVCFEVINTADGGVWQVKYITPDPAPATRKSMEDFRKAQAEMLDAFDDTRGHWAKDDIGYMAHEGLIQGVADRTFEPESTITRAEFITILDRAMGYEPVEADSFADVAKGEWYYTYIAAANKNGLLKDFPAENGFLPNQPITREEMALVIYNAIQAIGRNDEWVKTLPDDYANFTDTDKVSDYAKTALQYLIQTGIIKGTSDTTVSPEETANRAQAAVILKRFMSFFVWAGPPTDQEWVMTFNDEFLGDSLDWDVWVSDASYPGHILSSRWPENAVVKDGDLRLEVRKEEKGGAQWTAGNVWVDPNVFRQSYGYWEARYKIAAAPGINNSFWMITTNCPGLVTENNKHFELDINEGHYPNTVNTNYHSWYTGTRLMHGNGGYVSDYDLSADYHTYALEWTEDELIYYFDGKKIHTEKNENADTPVYPFLSSAVLNWAGSVTEEADGTAQVVDYVRVWQRKADAENPERTLFNQPVSGKDPASGSDIKQVDIHEQQVDNETYSGEIIIPCEVEGEWFKSSAIKNYNGGEHLWSKEQGASSKYSLKDVPKGKYKAYFWRLPHQYNVAQMDIMLSQNGEEKLAGSVALKCGADETIEPGWILLGEFDLTGDKDAYFGYVCNGSNCRATAIKLVPVK